MLNSRPSNPAVLAHCDVAHRHNFLYGISLAGHFFLVDRSVKTRAISLPCLAAYLSGTVGTVALIGWFFHLDILTTTVPGRVSMKVNTATAFLLLAISLCLCRLARFSLVQKWAAACVLLIGALTMAEYLFGVNLGIDEAIVLDYVRSAHPGRMALITATNFVLLGLALLPLKFRWGDYVRESLALLVVVVSTFAIVGYVYGVPALYGAINYSHTAMAFHTGVNFLLIATGFLFIRREQGWMVIFYGHSIGTLVARYLIPVAIVGPAALGGFFLRNQLETGNPRMALALSVMSNIVLLVIVIWAFSFMIRHGEAQTAMVQHKADTDSLTGVYNRRFFDAHLLREVLRARRYLQPLSLIMLDVDRFKQLNDKYGHQAGDVVLQQMTREVERNLRHSDVFCRYGGEEFAIVAPETPVEAALLLANRIRESVAVAPLEPIGRPVTISLGVASLTPTMIDPQELVSAADAALYTAKAEGRNRACIFQPSVPLQMAQDD